MIASKFFKFSHLYLGVKKKHTCSIIRGNVSNMFYLPKSIPRDRFHKRTLFCKGKCTIKIITSLVIEFKSKNIKQLKQCAQMSFFWEFWLGTVVML